MDARDIDRALAPAERWQRIIETAEAAQGLADRAAEADEDDAMDLCVEYDECIDRLLALIAAPEAKAMRDAVSRHLATGAGCS